MRRAWPLPIVAAFAFALVPGCRATTEYLASGTPSDQPICRSCTSVGCSSDDDCIAFRGVCVKPEGEMRGMCFEPKNLAGEHVEIAPREESAGPGGPGVCTADEQCPTGYWCRKMGASTGHCTE
jgi:hypothetical protein